MVPIYTGLFLLAAATFAFEISLTRVFSVAQFYHFAFMAVSLAMLGFGASGTVLTLWPRLARSRWPRRMAWLATAFGLSVPASYLLTNLFPFDSYSIAWDARQVGYLLMYYLLLAVPFALSGLVASIPLVADPGRANRFYAATLAGSGVGCLLSIALLPWLGGPGTLVASGLVGLLGAAGLAWGGEPTGAMPSRRGTTPTLFSLACLAGAVLMGWLALARPSFLEIQLSPYKGLTQALRYPGARMVSSDWNAYSRVDLLESPGVRQLPGLSYAYRGAPPPQLGLTVDGDDLSPVALIADPDEDLAFSDYLPEALAYRLRPGASTLILEPKGGLAVWTALAGGASSVTTVEGNPQLLHAARQGMSAPAGDVYSSPRVSVVTESVRSYLRRSDQRFDLVHLALTQPYRPVTSGAYSLSEDYLHTVEAFCDYLAHLKDGGLFVVTRWLQTPPSESVRTLAMVLEALQRGGGGHTAGSVVAFRGVQTVTFLAQKSGFSAAEMEVVREFCADRRFDVVVGPGVADEEINQYNVLPEPYYARAFGELMAAEDRKAVYAASAFDVIPSTDDHPFFLHFFRWKQTPAVLQTLGKTWQPFGGSGIFVLLAFLVLALLASVALVIGPLLLRRTRSGDGTPVCPEDSGSPGAQATYKRPGRSLEGLAGGADTRGSKVQTEACLRTRAFLYFGFLGLAYLLVEIPLIQRFIQLLGQPVYAMTAVLFALLVFSGLGSFCAPRLPHRLSIGLLAVLAIILPLLLPTLFQLALGLPLSCRFAVSVLVLAPLGFLMGVPFPKGIRMLNERSPGLIPWAWAVNGCTSVLGSVLAALGALSWGFRAVLGAGAICYVAVLLSIWTLLRRRTGAHGLGV